MKIALIQMPVTSDKLQNMLYVETEIHKICSTEPEIDLIVLPEMFCCPYSVSVFSQYAEDRSGPIFQQLSTLARKLGIYLIAGSIPEKSVEGKVYNTSFVFDRNGTLIAQHRKLHLFDIDITDGQQFKESDSLAQGDTITVFDTDFGKIGVAICYDIRFPELSRLMTDNGVRMIVVPAAFNMTTGPAHWEILFRCRAVDNQAFFLGCSSARNYSAEYVSYGNSIVVSPWGEVLYRLDEKPGTIIAELDLNEVDRIRKELPLLNHRRKDLYSVTQL